MNEKLHEGLDEMQCHVLDRHMPCLFFVCVSRERRPHYVVHAVSVLEIVLKFV